MRIGTFKKRLGQLLRVASCHLLFFLAMATPRSLLSNKLRALFVCVRCVLIFVGRRYIIKPSRRQDDGSEHLVNFDDGCVRGQDQVF